MGGFEIKYFAAPIEIDEYLDLDSANISKDPLRSRELFHTVLMNFLSEESAKIVRTLD